MQIGTNIPSCLNITLLLCSDYEKYWIIRDPTQRWTLDVWGAGANKKIKKRAPHVCRQAPLWAALVFDNSYTWIKIRVCASFFNWAMVLSPWCKSRHSIKRSKFSLNSSRPKHEVQPSMKCSINIDLSWRKLFETGEFTLNVFFLSVWSISEANIWIAFDFQI